MKKAHVITYGCRQNVSDSEKIVASLENQGYEIIDNVESADLIIFNTCAVREGAEERVFGNIGALKPLKKKRPNIKIAVCGCMAARPEVQARIKKSFPYVNLVFGTNEIHNLSENLAKSEQKRVFLQNDNEEIYELQAHHEQKVIANVPIMYGCNNFCSYCIVPYVRGRERSRKSGAIINEIKSLVDKGYKEVLLLGQNVNSYKSDIDFSELLLKVSEIDGIERIRFMSSHPKDFSDKLIDAMVSSEKICKQLHLPFQAGSNKVLADMNRNYTREHYISLIEKARTKIPNLTITSDVIVGFPTESQDDFEDTYNLVEQLNLDSLFTFIYSRRSGTPAAEMDFALAEPQIKENFERLLALQEQISTEKNAKYLGTVQKVLLEGESHKGDEMLTGRTDGGKIVNFTIDEQKFPSLGGVDAERTGWFVEDNTVPPLGSLIPVKITSTSPWALGGKA